MPTCGENVYGRQWHPDLAVSTPTPYNRPMSHRSAFQRGVRPLLALLLPGKEEAVLAIPPDETLRERIETLASKSTEGTLSAAEREEYIGYVQANKFVAIMRREARTLKANAAT